MKLTKNLKEQVKSKTNGEEKEEAVVAAAAGLEEASAAVAVGAGGAPAGPAVIGPSLPLALAMPLPEPEPLPLPLEVVRGLLPPLRIPELLSLRPRPRPPRPEPPPGLMALEVPEPLSEDKKKGKPEKLKRCIRTAAGSSWEDPSLLEWDAGEWARVQGLCCSAKEGEPGSSTPHCRAALLLARLLESQTVARGAGPHLATEQNWVQGIGA